MKPTDPMVLSPKQLALLQFISDGNAEGQEVFFSRDMMACGGWATRGGVLSAINYLESRGWIAITEPRELGKTLHLRVARPLSDAVIVDNGARHPARSSKEMQRMADPNLADRAVRMHIDDGIGLRSIADELGLFVGGAAAVRELLLSRGVVARSRNVQQAEGMRRHQDNELPWPKVNATMPPFNIYRDVAVDREAGTFAKVNGDMGFSAMGCAAALCSER